MTPLILDTDIGTDVDDAIALAFAARDPRIDLRAVTTVNGDTLSRARIAKQILELSGSPEVPIGAGARIGLSNMPNPSMPVALGHEGKGMPVPPSFEPIDALSLITQTLEGADEPVAVSTIGAVTNVAAALSARPDLCEKVSAVHVMGGCLGPFEVEGDPPIPGRPEQEYNLGCDPVATSVLFALPVAIRLVPIDVTMNLTFTDEDRRRIAQASELGAVLEELMRRWVDLTSGWFGEHVDRAKVRLHDPLTVAGIVEPDVETTEELKLSVTGRPADIHTVRSPLGRPVTGCRSADLPGLRELLVSTITKEKG